MADINLSRRRVVAGAAWSAPVIAMASAAPAYAASGPAQVSTVLLPATRSSSTALPVNISFVNQNTESTGLTTVIVGLTPAVASGDVSATAPTIQPSSSPGWSYVGSGGTAPERTFSFSRVAGIDGAPNATSTATTTLNVVVTVVPNGLGVSAGTIDVSVVPAQGNVSGASTLWT